MIHDIKVFNPQGDLLKVINGQKQMDKHFKVLAESIGKTGWGIAAKKPKKNIICPICKKVLEGAANQVTCGSAKCLRERVKVRVRYVTSRKGKKTMPYIHKIVCKQCGKNQMRQSENIAPAFEQNMQYPSQSNIGVQDISIMDDKESNKSKKFE